MPLSHALTGFGAIKSIARQAVLFEVRATANNGSWPNSGMNGFQAKKKQVTPKSATCRKITGAGNEARTRDLNLGKVALYQLSYSRVLTKREV